MKELLKNLAAAKKEIGAISKDSKNPFFKSKYFDINQLLEHVEPILLKNGLLLTQPIKENRVYSIVWDIKTGDSFESYLELPNLVDPQKIGSAISYYRRYSCQSLLSIQSEDDDGNKAAKKEPKKPVVLTDANIKSILEKKTQKTVLEGIKSGKFTATKEQLELLNK